ncbi:MAG: hypothetical protein ABIN74_11200, partial [Ferruginibacter sp.]
DKLLTQESLVFSNKDCRLILLHPQKGRFVIEPGNVTKQASGEYLGYIKNNLLLDIKKVRLSSRGKEDVESYFTTDPAINEHLLFIGESRIIFDTTQFRITDPADDFFFLQYTTGLGKTIINKLPVRKDKVIIRPADLLFDGAMLPNSEETLIGFVENYGTQKSTTEIGSFKPATMSLAECKKIMKAVKKALGKNRQKVINEIFTQLYQNYGKPDKKVLEAIYDAL